MRRAHRRSPRTAAPIASRRPRHRRPRRLPSPCTHAHVLACIEFIDLALVHTSPVSDDVPVYSGLNLEHMNVLSWEHDLVPRLQAPRAPGALPLVVVLFNGYDHFEAVTHIDL